MSPRFDARPDTSAPPHSISKFVKPILGTAGALAYVEAVKARGFDAAHVIHARKMTERALACGQPIRNVPAYLFGIAERLHAQRAVV